MNAERLIRIKEIFADGAVLQLTVWLVPEPVPPCRHRFKYSLFYGYPGRRLVAFDNERGKGDHLHLAEEEHAYDFVSIPVLLADFRAEVIKAGGRL